MAKIGNAEWLRQVHDTATTQAVQLIRVSAHQDRLDPKFRSSCSDGMTEPVRQPHVSRGASTGLCEVVSGSGRAKPPGRSATETRAKDFLFAEGWWI